MQAAHPLKAYRAKEGLTQGALASRLGVNRTSVARWETGARKIDDGLVDVVAKATGISVRDLRPDLAKIVEGG